MTGLSGETFDLLIIGGGINGCGVARDAAMRGLSVVLLERDDFGSGTSGRSSRLIHGGIRYLEQGQLHLVHESIRERQTLLRIAPHLVKPLAFTWPIYRGARVGKVKLSAGLLVYQLMAMGRSRWHSSLNAAETLHREPCLRPTGLTGGAVYYDACTDDARLTVANAIAARELGARIHNHTPVVRIIREAGKAVGAVARSALTGEEVELRGRVIVDATGVWHNPFDGDTRARRVRGSKGVHISVDRERAGNRDALTLISPVDGRVMFCLPAGPQTIIGTTDTWTDESPETVHAAPADVQYLLDSANSYFPQARLTPAEVVSAWAGIRPLASARAANPSAVSREHSIVTDSSGIIDVTGGKLTTYRSMAAEIVDRVQEALGQSPQPAPTAEAELPGAGRAKEIARMQREDPAMSEVIVEGLPYTAGHLAYAVQHELARTLSDLLIRRTHVAFETRDHGVGVARAAADIVAPLLRWDDATKAQRVREFTDDTARMFAIG
ncbi:MAG TPA: glycerol-3-phosphate dehydrogenase/oxidase [Gemmatimonadaceae bacterium]|jgi:glycerol-3-phosphate dehydrogenase|nr:glycerol-3-phosphate dehydrogenase/oxidase [Gemmatimonadaceae bacterium]